MTSSVPPLQAEEVWCVTVPTSRNRPRVGISVSLNFPGLTPRFREEMKDLIATTLEAVVEVGLEPILLDATGETSTTNEERQLQGVVVLGGGDIHPEIAGHSAEVPNSFGTDAQADLRTLRLIRQAAAREVPVLGICRGSQLLNVAFGGTIVPDLGVGTLHRSSPGGPSYVTETVLLEEGSRVRSVYDTQRAQVSAAHHQAIERPAAPMRVTAYAEDGVVEAIEHSEADWMVGIQWHPEAPGADRESFLRLLRAFGEHVPTFPQRRLKDW